MAHIKKNDLPRIDVLLSSMIRLMSNYVFLPDETQVMTLLHMIKQIKQHPDYEANQAVKVAVDHANSIWLKKVSTCQCLPRYKDSHLH